MIDKEIIAVFHYDDKGSKCCGCEPYRYAEEIVRCKECKKWGTDDCVMCNECQRNPHPTKSDDFCSYGERESE